MDKGKWNGESDADLDFRKIILFMAGMGAAIAVCTAIVFALGGFLTKSLVAKDPKASRIKVFPSDKAPSRGPILQPAPAADMAQMNREQDQILSSYAWVDRPAGFARIPIDRAIELVVVPSVAPSVAPSIAPSIAPSAAANLLQIPAPQRSAPQGPAPRGPAPFREARP